MLDNKFLEKFTRQFVVEHLSYKGRYNTLMTTDTINHCYTLADGFGPYDESLAEYFEGGLDWSHIRDSSDRAFADIANWIYTNVWGHKDDPFRMHVAKLVGECVLGGIDPNLLVARAG